MLPSYLEKLTIKEIRERAELLQEKLQNCTICPNHCEINRYKEESGNCNSNDEIFISGYGAHFGEESPLVGNLGSGTIFFTNCNMACDYCQNFDISQIGRGSVVSPQQLARIIINLQSKGCHNINLVTPTHYVPQILNSLVLAIEFGLEIPIVYNCGGYESVDTLKLLEDVIDIYMPDIKYSSNKIAMQLSGIENYWDVVKKALKEMHRQVGDLHIKLNGIATRGLLIRHLVLPNMLAGSEGVIKFIANDISSNSYLNIMDQYHPAYKAVENDKINRRINDIEFNQIIELAKTYSLTRGLES